MKEERSGGEEKATIIGEGELLDSPYHLRSDDDRRPDLAQQIDGFATLRDFPV